METKRERFIQAWKKVFDVDEVKDDDNFFEVGGDSMKGVQLVGVLAGYGLKLDMLKLYTQPTVEELVEAAEEMEPVEIPADVINGSLSGEEMMKYLEDPTIQKAMSEFGIRAEDIMERIGMNVKEAKPEDSKPASGAGKCGIPPFMTVQPGAMPVQAGYLIPVPVMYYFVPVSGPESMPAQPQEAVSFPGAASFPGAVPFPGAAPFPGAVPFQGAAPVPVMAYPVFLPCPCGTGKNPENADPDKKEQ